MARITQAELARRLGISRAAVAKAKKAGRITVGDDGLVDEAEAVAQWRARTRQAMAPAEPGPADEGEKRPRGGQTKYGSARARRELAKAQREELALARERGEVIAREDVDAAMMFIGTAVRSLLDVLPDQTAPLVAPTTDVDECHQLLTDACRDALNRLGEAMAREKARLGA